MSLVWRAEVVTLGATWADRITRTIKLEKKAWRAATYRVRHDAITTISGVR